MARAADGMSRKSPPPTAARMAEPSKHASRSLVTFMGTLLTSACVWTKQNTKRRKEEKRLKQREHKVQGCGLGDHQQMFKLQEQEQDEKNNNIRNNINNDNHNHNMDDEDRLVPLPAATKESV